LDINPSKSSIFFRVVSLSHKLSILHTTGFHEGCFTFTYLGVPLGPYRLLASQFSPLLHSLELSIQGWIGKHLIFAGRLELLRSVLYGKVQFWLNIFPLQEIVIRQISSIYRNFLWTGDVRKSTSALVAWKYVCLPKAEGGLRLFDIKARNMSFLVKQLWNIHLKFDSVWIRWVHHFYLRNEIIWTASAHHSSSPLWKSIIFLRDYTIQHYGSQYGSIALMSGWNSGMDKFMSHAYNLFRPSDSPVSWERVVLGKVVSAKALLHFVADSSKEASNSR